MAGLIARIAAERKASGFPTEPTIRTTDHAGMTQVANALGGGNMSRAGITVTKEAAERLSAVWACWRVLSESIGAMPWGMFQEDAAGNAKRVREHGLDIVLTQTPNAYMDETNLKEAKTLNLCQAGNAYSLVERTSSAVMGLMPVESKFMSLKLKRDGNTRLPIPDGALFYTMIDRGQAVDLPAERVWHVRGFGASGLVGLSPLGAAREAAGFALAAEEFGATFFRQGGMPAGTVSYPGFLNPQQKADAQEALNALVGGLGNAHKVALFQGGMEPKPWTNMPLKDMEFILLRQFSVSEICRFYRVPPHMVADLSRATFSNIEHMSREFVMFTLLPYLTRFEAAASRWLLTPAERAKGLYLRFNAEGLLRADSAGRAAYLSQMSQNGMMSRNEGRIKEGFGRSDKPGMDDFTVQSALTIIGKLGEKPEPAAPKPPAPPAEDDTTDSAEDSGKLLPRLMPSMVLAPNVSVALPEKMMHELDHKVTLESVEALRAVSESVARSVESLTTKLTAWQEVQRIEQFAFTMKMEAREDKLAKALDDHRKQRRVVTVNGETFVSEPIEG